MDYVALTGKPLSTCLLMNSKNSSRLVREDFPEIKPNCERRMSSCNSKCLRRASNIKVSNILKALVVRLTGLKLSPLSFEPF